MHLGHPIIHYQLSKRPKSCHPPCRFSHIAQHKFQISNWHIHFIYMKIGNKVSRKSDNLLHKESYKNIPIRDFVNINESYQLMYKVGLKTKSREMEVLIPT